jgi:hypothetical protein
VLEEEEEEGLKKPVLLLLLLLAFFSSSIPSHRCLHTCSMSSSVADDPKRSRIVSFGSDDDAKTSLTKLSWSFLWFVGVSFVGSL